MYLMVAFARELFESSCELRMTRWYECVARRGPGSETELHPICNLVVSATWEAYQLTTMRSFFFSCVTLSITTLCLRDLIGCPSPWPDPAPA
jgi:hypothetical protein